MSFLFYPQTHFIGKYLRNPFKKGLFFESTPENLYCRKAPFRIHDFNRDMKIIIVLREPVDRAFSAWTMYRMLANQKEGLPDIFYNGNELDRSEEHTSELQSRGHLVCRL